VPKPARVRAACRGNFRDAGTTGPGSGAAGKSVGLRPQDRCNHPPLVLRKVRFLSPGGLPVVLQTSELNEPRLSDETLRTIDLGALRNRVVRPEVPAILGISRTAEPHSANRAERAALAHRLAPGAAATGGETAAGRRAGSPEIPGRSGATHDPRLSAGPAARRRRHAPPHAPAACENRRRPTDRPTNEPQNHPHLASQEVRSTSSATPERPASEADIQNAKQLGFLLRLVCGTARHARGFE
jgi:hypothetical protein